MTADCYLLATANLRYLTHLSIIRHAARQVKSSDAAILEVVPVSKAAGVWQFQARLLQPIPIAPDSDASASLAVLIKSAQSQQNIRVVVQSAADESALLASSGACADTLTGAGQCAGRQAAYSTSSVLVTVVSNMGLIISVLIALAVAIFGKRWWGRTEEAAVGDSKAALEAQN